MTTKIDLTKIQTETLLLKMLLRAFEKLLMVPGVEVLLQEAHLMASEISSLWNISTKKSLKRLKLISRQPE